MGCCVEKTFKEADTRGPTTFEFKDVSQLRRMKEIEQFECTFPFYRMRIDAYEGRIKRYVNVEDSNAVSL